MAELVHQGDTGTHSSPSKITPGSFLERWLKNHALASDRSPETAQVHEIIARKHLIPALGLIPLQNLTPDRIQAYYTGKLANGRRAGRGVLSPRTVRHNHWLLHVVLENAVKKRMIQRNPADAVDAPRHRQKEHDLGMDVLSQHHTGVGVSGIMQPYPSETGAPRGRGPKV